MSVYVCQKIFRAMMWRDFDLSADPHGRGSRFETYEWNNSKSHSLNNYDLESLL